MRKVPLTQGAFALVDESDLENTSKNYWTLGNGKRGRYAKRRVGPSDVVLMHREIMGLSKGDGFVVDHINGNGLDNRRMNLRVCSNGENLRNRGASKSNKSGHKGISFDKSRNKWSVEICVDYKKVFRKRFTCLDEAVKAQREMMKKYHGDFARV